MRNVFLGLVLLPAIVANFLVDAPAARAELQSLQADLADQPLEAPAARFPADGRVVRCGGIGLNVRSGVWGTKIGWVPDHAKLKVVGEKSGWFEIRWHGKTAYVCGDYVDLDRKAVAARPADPGPSEVQPPVGANPVEPPAGDPRPEPPSPAKPESPTEPKQDKPPKSVKPPVDPATAGDVKLKVPLLGQPDGVTCAPTSLAMVLRYHGIKKSVRPELANLCRTNPKTGTNYANLVSAARRLGFEDAKIHHNGSLDWLGKNLKAGRPVICFVEGTKVWKSGHSIVVTGVDRDAQGRVKKVFVNDPAWGLDNRGPHSGEKLTFSASAFRALWSRMGSSALALKP